MTGRSLGLLAAWLLPFGLSVVLVMAQDPPGDRPEPGLSILLDRFGEADTDGDGSLSRDEFRAFVERLRRERERLRAALSGKAPVPEPTAANVPYGPHSRQVLDFWQAKSDKPTPVIVYIHGGGFVGGDKRSIDGQMITWASRDGISVAAIHYRFVTTDPFPAPMRDAARAVQFLRAKAESWNIDPNRIAAYGGSAGAGLSMWLGFHEDLADPSSDDPIARQSSRVSAVGSIGGQSTYDPNVIRTLVGGRAWEHPSLVLCYDLRSVEEAGDPAHQAAYDEASAITHLTPDDAPVFMIFSEPDRPLPPGTGPGVGIHHPVFGHWLKQEMDAIGIEAVYRHTEDGGEVNPRDELYAFLKKHLQGKVSGGD